MSEQGIKVSHGSISNIINSYKQEHEQPSQSLPSSISTTVDESIVGSPSFHEDGLATVQDLQDIDFSNNAYSFSSLFF
jgi:hypothetical protein